MVPEPCQRGALFGTTADSRHIKTLRLLIIIRAPGRKLLARIANRVAHLSRSFTYCGWCCVQELTNTL